MFQTLIYKITLCGKDVFQTTHIVQFNFLSIKYIIKIKLISFFEKKVFSFFKYQGLRTKLNSPILL